MRNLSIPENTAHATQTDKKAPTVIMKQHQMSKSPIHRQQQNFFNLISSNNTMYHARYLH